MTAPWRKVLRDVWQERTRAALVVLAIAVGLIGFFAVLSTYAILRRELNLGYLATNPASAVLRTDAIDEALLASVNAREEVADADARRVLTGRIRTGPTSSRRIALFVIRDFRQLRISTITSDTGAWPPAAGELLIERDAFRVARATIGDTVTIQLNDREHTLRVAGGVHDAGQAQARMENMVYGYISPDTLPLLGEERRLDRLLIVADGPRFDEAHVRRVAGDVRTMLESSGHAVSRVDVPRPGEHPHAAIMGLLLLAMAAFGLFALVLSGVIVMNLILAMMAVERRQIGVMKAIGATRGQIGRIYLAEAGVFGAAAFALAIPIGIVAGRDLSRRFAILLNFDLTSLAVPMWVYLLVAVVALVVPVAAALYPVARGTAVTVHTALMPAGIDAAFGSSRIDRMLCGVGGAGRPWLLGIRNSMRRRTRTLLTLAMLSIAGTFFTSALNFRTSMIATADRLFGAGTYGAEFRYAFDQHMLMIYVFLFVAAGGLAVVGGLGLITAMSLNALERRRELGVLRAIGASPSMIGGIVVIEAMFVAIVSWMIAVPAGFAIAAAIGRLLTSFLFKGGLDLILDPIGVVGWLTIASVVAVVASVVPALSASRRSIREAISYE